MDRRRLRVPARLSLVASVAAGVLVAVAVPVLTAPASAAVSPASCSVSLSATYWPGGFTAAVRVTNLGAGRSGWSLVFDWGGDQRITSGWSGVWSQSGRTVTVTNAPWNGNLPAGETVDLGVQGSWTANHSAPSQYLLSGVRCQGPTTISTTTTTTSTTTTTTTTTTPLTTTTTATGGQHVDNPYAGVTGYVNPQWRANAESVAGGSRVSGSPTAVWLDRISDITGAAAAMGVRAHLDAALAQGAGYIQFVLHDLPGRDCVRLESSGDFTPDELSWYRSQFVDPLVAIEADPRYASLRIVNIVEPAALADLLTSVDAVIAPGTCRASQVAGTYRDGIQYALGALHAAGPNTYQYLDASHRSLLGYDTNFGPAVQLLAQVAKAGTGGVAAVDGITVGVSDYGPTTEPFLKSTEVITGSSVRQSNWVDWDPYVDELPFAQAFRDALVTAGLDPGLGIVLDTSRNGWGGPARPAAKSTSSDLNTYVNQSRIDRRLNAGNYCNQSGAGLGARPAAAPGPANVDAWAWVKPPGESDGASTPWMSNPDPMCDPNYGGSVRNSNNPSGAMPDAPDEGQWFPVAFAQLMSNAYPPLP